jgi:HlyD family secretion protein
MKMNAAKPDARSSLLRHVVAGVAIVTFLAAGLGGWAAVTELSGAVIAQGQLVVDSNVKKVQHPTGGVVGELKVRDGDRVKAGDIVVRLDETQPRANLAIVLKGLDELAARQARNEAERDGADNVVFPADLMERMNDPDVAHVVGGEQRLFELRRESRESQKAQLREQVEQFLEQIRGLEAQESAKVKEIDWVWQELIGVRELWHKHLVQFTRVTSLERDSARLEGERGQLIASVAQARGKIAETELKILQVDQDMRTEVGKDLGEIRAKRSELVEKRASAEDQLKRIDIRAPQDGRVHQLAVHTVGGVVTQSESIMLIVPQDDALIVEARIQPNDIDQLRVGQPAVLRFTAFNVRTTPELNGTISVISADVMQDPKTNLSYYIVRISVPDREIIRLNDLKLVPGMPVDAFIETSPRTVLSYLIKPLEDQVNKAFKEK